MLMQHQCEILNQAEWKSASVTIHLCVQILSVKFTMPFSTFYLHVCSQMYIEAIKYLETFALTRYYKKLVYTLPLQAETSKWKLAAVFKWAKYMRNLKHFHITLCTKVFRKPIKLLILSLENKIILKHIRN